MNILQRRDGASGLAAEFDRIFPDQVDTTPRDWGNGYESGHIGFEHGDGEPMTVGWFCDAGSVGNPVMDFPAAEVPRAAEILREIPAGSEMEAVESALRSGGVHFVPRY